MTRVLTIIALLTGLLAAFTAQSGTVVDQVLARVGNDIITQSDFDRELQRIREDLSRRFQGDELEKNVADTKKTLLNLMVDQKLLEQRANELGLATEDEVNAAVKRLRDENNFPDDQALDHALKQEGTSLQELKADFRKRIIAQKILWNYVQSKVNITEDEMKGYYEKNKNQMVTEPVTRLTRFLVASDEIPTAVTGLEDEKKDAGNGTQTQAQTQTQTAPSTQSAPASQAKGDLRQEADRVVADIKSGKQLKTGDYPHLQVDETADFARSDIEEKLAAKIDKVAVGEVSDPIEIQRGWLIIKIEERRESKPIPFEDARSKIYNALLQERAEKYQKSFLEDLRKQSYVVINQTPS